MHQQIVALYFFVVGYIRTDAVHGIAKQSFIESPAGHKIIFLQANLQFLLLVTDKGIQFFFREYGINQYNF